MTSAERAGMRGGFPDLFKRMVQQTIDRGGNIRFNLDKVNVRNALSSNASWLEDYTAWELRQIAGNKQWLKNTVFYNFGRRVDVDDLVKFGLGR